MKGKISILGILMAITLNVSAGASEGQSKLQFGKQFAGTHVSFAVSEQTENTSLTVVGPNGFHARAFEESGMPSVNLLDYGKLADGLYQYEILTMVGDVVFIKDTINNGRGENDSHYARRGITQNGHFWVKGGQIMQFRQSREPNLPAFFGVK